MLRRIITSRFVHLTFGLFVLYGVSLAVTHTTRFERILDSLRWCAYADYLVRDSRSAQETLEFEFYKERYSKRLGSLTEGLFDAENHEELQAFLLSRGLVYEVWSEAEEPSYLLAPIVESGDYALELDEKVDFEYYLLGSKTIAPWREYQAGLWAGNLVSEGEEKIYLHLDIVDYLLRRYFNTLWALDARRPEEFRWEGWPLTYPLSIDLQEVCEDVFTHRLYRSKRVAREYFVREGFDVFLPTMLAMGARMAADRNSDFLSARKYKRAYITGLYMEPNYTMLTLLSHQYSWSNPPAAELWDEFSMRLHMDYLYSISLGQISEAARNIFENL